MTHRRIAYMPLVTYPEAIADDAIRGAVAFAEPLGCTLSVTTFAVDVPSVSSGLGDFLIDIPSLVHSAEQKSLSECHRLHRLAREAASTQPDIHCTTRGFSPGNMTGGAAMESRYFDLTLLPWADETNVGREMVEAVVFGSGRPAILVPPSAAPASLDHIAIAWDGSPVAARALGDVLPFVSEGGLISVLTIRDEKPLTDSSLAETLASTLVKRGFKSTAVEANLGKRNIADALQDTALSNGAQLLAMGGFGHSRIRDFVLGGATRGILRRLQLPVLLSH